MSGTRLSGTWAAAVTPLRADGTELDEEAFDALWRFYADGGVDGLLVLGTTGEGILLGTAERRRVAELAVTAAGGLGTVIHCGAQSTADTVALAAHAAEIGADGVAVIGPPYFAFDEDELLAHFLAAAAACAPLPFYAYEFAARSGYAIPLGVLERLRDRAENLAGVKVSDTPFEQVAPYLTTGLDVFIGAEPLIQRGLAEGAVGAVSGLAAAFPAVVSALVREPSDARCAQAEALRRALSAQRFQASVKVALALQGVPVRPDVRAPLRPLDAQAIAPLRAELERLLGADALSGAAPAAS
jgi:dihydrodipicolinate synthase/N-acetylneuraminate lyase